MLKKYIKNDRLRDLAEWAVAILMAVAAYFFIRTFLCETAEISGPSMDPTLAHGERVVINKAIYKISNPQRGDIIAFPYPANPEKSFVKRIIGIPGDTIDIIDDYFYLNGELLDDDFASIIMSFGDLEMPIVVGEDEYFVLGDNRNSSQDSRNSNVGNIKKENITGRISLRYWPLNAMGVID